ncbi:phage tail tape measure protein [Rhodococcus sp. (in: high G+C Gram-positive bacteria)]|uniref:phage tail tape measure protein n=1 Tax=Rhodococcus sp. TaxID=1831 RepID=UPI001A351D3B|nr:phage tail tape measure protein [Rhodococcus sp. (in: high G+C Gram-positive bacteria)]MBJ7481565.1 phage tail tape measure protein [Rhodococcus sp. (in: high G+C Gram-positive bacteria)]
MALDVGELVARLTLDDSRFIQGTQRSEQQSRQSTQRISNGFQDITRAAARAGEAAQAVEINRQLDRQAQQAAQRIQELERNAQRANQSVDDIDMNDRLLNEARDAARGIDEIRAGARQAAGALNDIELGNRLRQDLQAAQGDLDDLYRQAGDGGAGAGDQAGGNFLSGFTDTIGNLASSTGPIAGSLLGVAVIGLTAGAALAAAIQEGMQQEQNQDLFQAQTGVTEAQARKFGLAAGESYADAFGESIEGNLATAKAALASGLLDPAATQRDAEKMINSLDGVATIIGDEIPAVAKAAGQAIKTGFAVDAQDAFDLIVKGSQMGLNVSEDWLDTINEYGTQFRKLGLSGADGIGLMSQALKAGARDTDLAADALKEFSIRAIDGSKSSAEGYAAIGQNAEEMTSKIAKGGEDAREGLGIVLEGLRNIEDPAERATAAVALFGTQSEDLGEALYAMDLSTATKSLNDYEGAAWRAINVMGDNAGTSVQGAMNSISVASDGMKAALAQAFGPYIKDFADNISNNRAGVIQFFIDVGNGAFEGAKAVLGFVADGMRGLAEFASAGADMSVSILRSLADMVGGLDTLSTVISLVIPGFDAGVGGLSDKLNGMADAAEKTGEGIKNGLNQGADFVDNTLVPAVDQAQNRFNEFAGDMKLSAAFNDETAKVNKAIADIGVGADGAAIKIENWTGSIDRNNEAQVKMDDGLKGMSEKLQTQIKTGMEAGNTVEALTGQYNENYDALLQQVMATGMSNQAAVDYLATLGLTPEFVDTTIRQPGMPEAKYELDVLKDKVIGVPDSKTVHTQALTKEAEDNLTHLGFTVEHLPDGTVKVTAPTDETEAALRAWINQPRNLVVLVDTQRTAQAQRDFNASGQQGPVAPQFRQADGSVRTRADGMIDTAHIQQGSGQGIYTKSPLGPVQYAEGETQWEAYIPGAPSKRKRSEAILQDVARRFGFGLVRPDAIKMADGGVVESFTGIASQHAPGLQLTSSYRDTNDYHGQGKAVDYSNGSGNTDEQLAWANYLADNYQSQLAELIYSDPRFTRNIKDGKIVDPSFYGAATMQQHENHVHAASKEPLGAPSGAGKDAAPAAPDTRTEREKIADQVIAEGKRRGISDKGIKAAVMTALAETDLQNLDHGMDGDNAGIMQQRDNGGWGTLEDRKDPTRAAGMFYDKLDDFDYNSMSEAEAAQKVQQSGTADGSNYAVKAAEADEIIAASNARGNGSQMTVGTTDSGAALATDGQRVFVTNWPGTSSSSYSAPESAPSSAPAGGTSDAAGKDPNLIWSGGFKVFENGGMNLPDQAGLYSDGADLIRFAEKGTGGESYIPHAPSKRNRSVAITRETARRFGYELVPMADGGLTGFGGYVGDKPGLKVPTTANGRRAAAYNAAAFGVGAAFALASGFDADGKFTGQFDTGSNSSSQLEKGFENATKEIQPVLEQILLAIKNREPIRAEVNVDRDSGMANINILKGGI